MPYPYLCFHDGHVCPELISFWFQTIECHLISSWQGISSPGQCDVSVNNCFARGHLPHGIAGVTGEVRQLLGQMTA